MRVDETTLSDAFIKNYKIVVEVQISATSEEFQQMERWSSSNWYYKNFSETATRETYYGIQMRRDVWNENKRKRFLINAMIQKSATFDEDIATAKRMVESIKLIATK